MTITEIIPNLLFLGGVDDAESKDEMRRLNIKKIYNVAKECRAMYFHLGIVVHSHPIVDSPHFKIQPYIEPIIDDMHKTLENKDPVYVHCKVGRSRSVTIVLAYLVKYQNQSLVDAINFVELKRGCISPNAGFMKELVDFEIKIRGTRTLDPDVYADFLRKVKYILDTKKTKYALNK